MNGNRAKLSAAAAMAIFGTIGVFRRFIDLPSGALALSRAVIGAVFLLALMALRGRKADKSAVRRNFRWLLASGACLGGNWILLFEAYNFTSVAVATLCYEMGPVLVLLVSPLLFGERLGRRKTVCAALSVLGVVLASGVLDGGAAAQGKGIALALGAAGLYAGVMLCNRMIRSIEPMDRTVCQLAAAAVVMLPYVLLAEGSALSMPSVPALGMVAVVGVVHTGIAYALYFGALGALPSQTAALLSYIDPALAVLLSAFLLREPIGAAGVLGAALVLGATLAGEIQRPLKKRARQK
ncbi:MAG: EamA family transporter [Clostridia bacterium]|nr:EamA family transporter [Clostridia bacterium]